MLLYRICSTKHVHDLSGTGAKKYGGRWTQKGYNCLYLADHPSLALLEISQFLTAMPIHEYMKLVTFSVSERVSVETITKSELPIDWNIPLGIDRTKEIGTRWLKQSRSVLLKVPSAICPQSFSFLANPAHVDFSRISLISVESVNV